MKLKKKYKAANIIVFTLMLLLPLFSWGDAPADNLFKQANQQYAKAQYQQAAKTYQQILNAGYQSAAVYFNTGNAYYKLDDMASAILYYEKARKLAPNDPDIHINIQLANLKTTDKIEQQPEFFVSSWWHNFILLLPAGTLSLASGLLVLTGFLLLIVYLFSTSIILKKTSFYTGVLAIVIGLLCVFMANKQINYFNNHHQAIVFSSSVVVKSSPDLNAKPLFVMHEGTKVNVNQKNGKWIEVELSNGNSGWVTADNIKDI